MITRKIVRSRATSRPKSSKDATQWEVWLEGKGKRRYRVRIRKTSPKFGVAFLRVDGQDQRLSEEQLRGLRAVQVAP